MKKKGLSQGSYGGYAPSLLNDSPFYTGSITNPEKKVNTGITKTANVDLAIAKEKGNVNNGTQTRQVDNPDLNGFIEYLNDFANDLAGKTGGLDRAYRNTEKMLENQKSSQQSMPNDIGSTAPEGDVGNNKMIPPLSGHVNLENELNFARESALGIEM